MESALPGRFFRVIAVLWCIPERKRVQAPSAPGFKPQRGAPLRGRLYKKVVFAALRGQWGDNFFPKARGLRRFPSII